MNKFLLIFIFLHATRIEHQEFNYFVIWNVGQGLWQSYITPSKCYHFDLGGEQAPWSLINRNCKTKKNIIRISHWDWDHYSFLKPVIKKFQSVCFSQKPIKDKKVRSKKYISMIKACSKPKLLASLQSFRPSKAVRSQLSQQHGSNSNSEVIIFKEFLLTGDSPKEIEKLWIQRLNFKKVQKLIVGHHGSKTSTSMDLLMKLKKSNKFFVGIVSARKKRYGHPHWSIVRKFKSINTPLISTEKWGHIIYRD